MVQSVMNTARELRATCKGVGGGWGGGGCELRATSRGVGRGAKPPSKPYPNEGKCSPDPADPLCTDDSNAN